MSDYFKTIKTKYDIKDHVEADIVIPNLPQDGIVLIVGTSGSGKSTILRNLGHNQAMTMSPCSTVIENFSTAERGEELLLASGLRSIPAWFRTPSTLSNGEYHRFEMAVAIDQGIQCIDEFTSVVDRDTAKALATICITRRTSLYVLGSSANTFKPKASKRAAPRAEVAINTKSGLAATTLSMLGSSPPPMRGRWAIRSGQLE